MLTGGIANARIYPGLLILPSFVIGQPTPFQRHRQLSNRQLPKLNRTSATDGTRKQKRMHKERGGTPGLLWAWTTTLAGAKGYGMYKHNDRSRAGRVASVGGVRLTA